MEQLSAELQLQVIEYLTPRDIVRFQQTCKNFCAAVEDSALSVWKECLWRQCLRNGVFWPTYKDLTEASGFKIAATSPARFIKAYERAVASAEQVISPNRVTVKVQGIDPDWESSDQYLVPGGRYLLIFNDKGLSMWDLGRLSSDNRPMLLLSHAIPGLHCVHDLEVVESLIIRVFIRVTPSSRGLAYQVIEISSDGGESFVISNFKSLSLDPGGLSYLDHSHPMIFRQMVALRVGENITAVWNYGRDEYALVGVDLRDSFAFGVFMNDTHMFYPTQSGICGVKIPPLRPVVEGFIEVPLIVLDSPPEDTFTCSPGHDTSALEIEPIIVPEVFRPWHTSKSTSHHIYTYQFIEDTDETHRRFRRYNFIFNPDSPAESRLQLDEVSEDRQMRGYNESLPTAESHRVCDGRLATLWSDGWLADLPSIHVSIGTPIEPGSLGGDSNALGVADTSESTVSMQLVEIKWTLDPKDISMEARLPALQLCPISGKVVVLWESPAGEFCADICDCI